MAIVKDILSQKGTSNSKGIHRISREWEIKYKTVIIMLTCYDDEIHNQLTHITQNICKNDVFSLSPQLSILKIIVIRMIFIPC